MWRRVNLRSLGSISFPKSTHRVTRLAVAFLSIAVSRRGPQDVTETKAPGRFDLPKTAPLAERQLNQILRSGILEKAITSTAKTRTYARKGRKVEFSNATPWKTFQQHTKDDPNSVDYARECMVAFNERLRRLHPHEALTEIQEIKLGEQCLNWMWESSQDVRDACGRDLKYLQLLAHFIVAEELESALWAMLKERLSLQPATRDRRIRNQNTASYSWCSRMIGHIVRVHYGRNVNSSANEALQFFIWVHDFKKDIPAARCLHPAAALTFLTRGLDVAGTHTNTDASVFDAYLAVHRQIGGRTAESLDDLPIDQWFSLARLSSVHPTNPDPDPLLNFYRKVASDENHTFMQRFHHPRTFRSASSNLFCVQGLISLLRKQNRSQDAESLSWLLDMLTAVRKDLRQSERRAKYAPVSLGTKRNEQWEKKRSSDQETLGKKRWRRTSCSSEAF